MNTKLLQRGFVILVSALRLGEGAPQFRGYIVAQDDPDRALESISHLVHGDEKASILGKIPGPALAAFGLEPGSSMPL